MPNWVHNSVFCQGPKKEVDAFVAFVKDEMRFAQDRFGPNQVDVHFDTAWDWPLIRLVGFAKEHRQVVLQVGYSEELAQFSGAAHFVFGKLVHLYEGDPYTRYEWDDNSAEPPDEAGS